MRPRPVVDAVNEPFWRAVGNGKLELAYCPACRRFTHPPRAHCGDNACGGVLKWCEVSGRGVVWAVTTPRREWVPGFDRTAPYGLFVVQLDEQADLLMTSDCDLETARQLAVGQPVEVTFEAHEGYTLPQFRPVSQAEAVTP
jgi:uncharacterized OB-fold protein